MSAVHLVDADALVHRAYHASLAQGGGRTRPDAGPWGMAAYLRRVVDGGATHVAVCFDRPSDWRRRAFPGYKASRNAKPQELSDQLMAAERLARSSGFAAFAVDGFEADDVLGTLCRRLREAGRMVVVHTEDKDLAQLVGDGVELADYRGGRTGPAEVRARLGVRPDQVPDLLGLAGDPSDGIPGVERVGRKTAAALLGHFSRLEDIFESLDHVAALPLRGAAQIVRRLREGEDAAYLCRDLATVSAHAPIGALSLSALRYSGAAAEVSS